MFDHLTELMLKSYFLAQNTVGRFSSDPKELFTVYRNIFLLTDEEAERLYALTQDEEVLAICSEGDYHRHLRMEQYLAMNAYAVGRESEREETIALKGTAYTAALSYQIMHDAKDARHVACESMTSAAESGVVLAMNALGVLQTEGIVYGKDEAGGLERIRNAADWNSEEALFAALRYDPKHREKYLERLHACLVRAGHAETFDRVAAVYGTFTEGKHREYLLLEKAFRHGILKRDVYNKSYARLVYSKILGQRDKETLLLTPNKELFAEASSLPLKLGHGVAEFRGKAFDLVRPSQREEHEKILCALKNTDLRTLPSYRPLCLVSDSKYMLDYYASSIPNCFASPHVERIEIGDLADYDLEPTPNNVFVRGCDEDVFNVYLLSFRGNIGEKAFDAAKNFLQSGKRGKFRLNRPGVVLDLSLVLPICLCDRENAKKLKAYCDIVRIAGLTAAEKLFFTEESVRVKAETYGLKRLSLQEGLAEKLSVYGMDDIDGALDAAVREHRADELTLTEEMMSPYFKDSDAGHGTYGFGGSIHDDNE